MDGSALVSGDGNAIDQSRTVNIYYGLPQSQPAPNRTDRNEKTLINAVWTEVDDRLRQSLHNAILIRLDMAEQRSQVSRPWDSELRTADQKPKTLAPGTPIAEVFDRRDVGGKLLVLGNPGAGKTTTMLDLAATLVQRANGDPDEPIPVIFNLSSWTDSQQNLTEWMWTFLKEHRKFFIRKGLWKLWLKEKKIIPLLDGLDELPPERQEPVIKAINSWLQSEEGATRLLVCSRLEEYELYASKLDLNGAICLSPLTDEQLQSYLDSLGMAHLWETLQHDADLLALVRTPLLLSVSILANADLEVAQWRRLQATQEWLNYLLDAYIGRRLHELVNSKAYPPGKQPTARQTRYWLVWLAKQLQAQSKDEFLIENMQPGMLGNSQLAKYKLFIRLIFGIAFGLIGGFGVGASFSVIPCLPADFCTPGKFFFWGSMIGTIAGFMSGISILELLSKDKFGFADTQNEPRNGIQIMNFDLSRFFRDENFIDSYIGFNFSIKNFSWEKFTISLYQSILLGMVFGMLLGALGGFFAAAYSLTPEVSEQFKQAQDIFSWNILDVILGLLFIVSSALFIVCVVCIAVLAGSCLGGISISMLIMLTGFGPIIGLIGAFRADIVSFSCPNQGVKSSVRQAIFVFFSLFISSLFGIPFLHISFNSALALRSLVNFSYLDYLPLLFINFSFTLYFSVYFGGGFTAFQHAVLRFLIFQDGYIPWNYARFLNHCTDRLLLQRVGGRYRFIHRLVQERFAAMPLDR